MVTTRCVQLKDIEGEYDLQVVGGGRGGMETKGLDG
jgi:hypothetical protein